MRPSWSAEDSTAAIAEGWEIFQVAGREEETEQEIVNGRPYGERPWELQADDEAGIFADDAEAWKHVTTKAAEGSALHQRALAFLQAHSPNEYQAVVEAR
jgi:hypothetical protein